MHIYIYIYIEREREREREREWRKKIAFFSNNCNFFIFNIKKFMLTPKQPVINAVVTTYIDYSITENYIGKSFLPYTRPEPLVKVLHHIC